MLTVKVQYAKTHLSALLAAVEQGEEVLIARGTGRSPGWCRCGHRG